MVPSHGCLLEQIRMILSGQGDIETDFAGAVADLSSLQALASARSDHQGRE